MPANLRAKNNFRNKLTTTDKNQHEHKNAFFLSIALTGIPQLVKARIIPATPANFQAKVPYLLPGDRLQLAAGTYKKPLNINGLNGTAAKPIVIMGAGNATLFITDACCKAISLRKSAYIVIKNMKLDGAGTNRRGKTIIRNNVFSKG